MVQRIFAILILLAMLLSACDVLISKAVDSIGKVIETNPPQIIITKEVITTV